MSEAESRAALEREAFEAAMARLGYHINPGRYADGSYRETDYSAGWEAWQARAALSATPAEPVGASAQQAEQASDAQDAARLLLAMPDEKRLEVFAQFCTFCGCNDPHCQCSNDE